MWQARTGISQNLNVALKKLHIGPNDTSTFINIHKVLMCMTGVMSVSHAFLQMLMSREAVD